MRLTSLFDLAGKVAVVTGGSSGVGASMAEALGMAGARVVLVSRQKDALDRAVAALLTRSIESKVVAGDLSDSTAIEGIGRAALACFGRVDILINAAGINLRESFESVTVDSWEQQINIHLAAPMFMVQTIAPDMQSRGWGRIINIASLQSFRAFANSAPYGAAKGGIIQLTRAIAQRWSSHGITCNAVGPGFFPTQLTAPVFNDPQLAQHHAQQTAIGRNGEMRDLWGITVFLASDASSYITGQTIMVDGGYTAK